MSGEESMGVWAAVQRQSAKRLIAESRRHRERGDDLAAASTLEESIRHMVRCEVYTRICAEGAVEDEYPIWNEG